MPQAKKTTYKGRVFKTASKVRSRQLKAGKSPTKGQTKAKAREMLKKRKGKDFVETAFGQLRSGSTYVTRGSGKTKAKAKPKAKPKATKATASALTFGGSKSGSTKKTKTVRRIAGRKGVSRAAANKIRKSRKS